MNVHLVVLHLVLEKELIGPAATAAITEILKQASKFVRLEPLDPAGRVTVLDVVKAGNLEEHPTVVDEWTSDVWSA